MAQNYILVQHEQDSEQRGIMCLTCGLTSWHPQDVEHRYCGRCQVFHDDVAPAMQQEGGLTGELAIIPVVDQLLPGNALPLPSFPGPVKGWMLIRLRWKPGHKPGQVTLEAGEQVIDGWGPFKVRTLALRTLAKVRGQGFEWGELVPPEPNQARPVGQDDTFLYYLVPVIGRPSGRAR